MSTTQFLIFIAPFAVTILLIFGMKYFAAAWQARARIADDALYRGLAERAVAAQSDLIAIRTELGKVAASLGVIEKILQQVE